jgi:hypothetical protein
VPQARAEPGAPRADASPTTRAGLLAATAAQTDPLGWLQTEAGRLGVRVVRAGRMAQVSAERGAGPGAGSSALGSALGAACAGLVVGEDGEPLAAPPGALRPAPAAAEVDRALAAGTADVIRLDDGSVFTLYARPDGGWGMATARGFDVGPLYGLGDRTFAQNFVDLLRGRYPAVAARLEAAVRPDGRLALRLPPGRCYTLGMRTAGSHPLRIDPPRAWFIQSVAVGPGWAAGDNQAGGQDGGRVGNSQDGGQGGAAGWRPDAAVPPELAGIPAQEVLRDPPRTAAALREALRDALAEARACVKLGRPPAGGLRYGFVVRARDPDDGPAVDCLVESDLIARLRRLAYDRPPRHAGPLLMRAKAAAAFLAVDPADRADFAELFPDEAQAFGRFQYVENMLVAAVESQLPRAGRPGPPPGDRFPPAVVARAAAVAAGLVRGLVVSGRDSAQAPSIVRDHIHCPDSLWMLCALDRDLTSPPPVPAVAPVAPVAAAAPVPPIVVPVAPVPPAAPTVVPAAPTVVPAAPTVVPAAPTVVPAAPTVVPAATPAAVPTVVPVVPPAVVPVVPPAVVPVVPPAVVPVVTAAPIVVPVVTAATPAAAPAVVPVVTAATSAAAPVVSAFSLIAEEIGRAAEELAPSPPPVARAPTGTPPGSAGASGRGRRRRPARADRPAERPAERPVERLKERPAPPPPISEQTAWPRPGQRPTLAHVGGH